MKVKHCPFMSRDDGRTAAMAGCASTCALAVFEVDADGTPSGRWRCGLVPPVLEFGEAQAYSGEAREGFGPSEAPDDRLE